MKVAVIIARTAKGFAPVLIGEDIAAINRKFKGVKVTGALTVDSVPAEQVFLFDTTGRVRRVNLDSPATLAARREATAGEAAKQDQAAEQAEAAKAIADGTAQAHAVAEKAIAVIASALTPGAGSGDEEEISLEDVSRMSAEIENLQALVVERGFEREALRAEVGRMRAELVKLNADRGQTAAAEIPAEAPADPIPAATDAEPAAESPAEAESNPGEHFGGKKSAKRK